MSEHYVDGGGNIPVRSGRASKVDEDAYESALLKVRKLRLLDHVPIKDSPPPAVTFKAVMERGLGGAYEDAAIDYVMRRFLKYYLDATLALSSKERQSDL